MLKIRNLLVNADILQSKLDNEYKVNYTIYVKSTLH